MTTTKTFNGKEYKLRETFTTKGKAKIAAEHFKSPRSLVRVVKTTEGYQVYTHYKGTRRGK